MYLRKDLNVQDLQIQMEADEFNDTRKVLSQPETIFAFI